MNTRARSMQTIRTMWTRKTLALAMAAAFCAGSAFGATVSSIQTPAAIARATTLTHGDAVLGALPMKQPIHVEVALKLRNKDVLDAFVTNAARNQARGVMTQPMSSAQFLANHAPTQAHAQAVSAYLISMGFRNVTIAPNRLLVSADGTALTAGVAFQTAFAQVRTHDGRMTYENTQDAHVPLALKDTVLAVVGLQDVHRLDVVDAKRVDSEPTTAWPRVGHNPFEFSSIYGGAGVTAGPSVEIDILLDGDFQGPIADLMAFALNNGVDVTPGVNLITPISTDTSHRATWDLESQAALGMAGGQSDRIIFYAMPALTDAYLTSNLNLVLHDRLGDDPTAKIISVAFTECETAAQTDGSAAADDMLFESALAQGMTFAVAAGDTGADECGDGGVTPSWPASSPYVVAVGGTSLVATTTTWQTETAWSKGLTGTGGSLSTFEPAPFWQQSYISPATTRGVPDVAFDADPNSGAKIVVNGVPVQMGGTALSVALFAGQWARATAILGNDLGFAGQRIYEDLLPRALHDITSGCNSVAPGQCAKAGYDLVSGRGSINLGSALQRLAVQLLGNPGFEATKGPKYWVTTAGVISDDPSEPTHSGSWDAWLDGKGVAGVAAISQQVAIPASYRKATLGFYLHIDTAETTTKYINDHLIVRVLDSSGNQLAQLAEYSNLDAASGYTLHTFDLSPYIGQTVTIKFTGNENASLQTSFVLDDVALNVQ